jgi:type I restriction enzyme S subunit
VIDQGKSQIGGYTNCEDLLYSGPIPVIMFGDHTREWKFLNFPFVAGADGTQLLTVASDVDPRFIYYAAMNLDIPNLGYSRHFKELRELSFVLPPLPEQRKIAAILSSVDEAIEKTQAVIDQVQVVKKGLMQELLTKGLPGRHQKFKQTEIGTIPESWEVVDLDHIVDQQRPICYGILKPGTGVPNGVPVVKVKDIKNGRVVEAELLLTSPDIDQQYKRSRLRAGDLLLTIRGTPGRLAVVPASLENANITQDTARIAVLAYHSSAYVRRALESPGLQGQIEHNTVGQAVKGINIGAVRKLQMPLPGFQEQSAIADIIDCVDVACDANVSELVSLRTLKSALMQSLLTGQLRVTP